MTLLIPAGVQMLDAQAQAAYPNVQRYFLHWVNVPEFKAVMGEVKLCEHGNHKI